ncbi:MAG: glycosyltransferase family 2 protein [Acutalibacteraceae bacterium]
MKCKISFVIPVYNAQKYLRECVDSIIAQDSFENIQVVLVDDGSSDASGAICDMYSDRFENIKSVHQKNSGVSAARNNGIAHSEGEYIAFADADDYLLPGILPKLIDAAEQSPDVIFFNFISEYKEFYDYIKYPFNSGMLSADYIKKDVAEFMLTDSSLNSVWNKLFKKSVITDNNISFPEDKKYGEDKVFVLSFFAVCDNAFFIPDFGYFYRYVKSGAIQKSRDNYIKNLYSDFEYTVETYKSFNLDSEFVYKTCREIFAQQIVATSIMAYRNCDGGEFDEVMKSFFENSRLMSDARKLYDEGFYKTDRDVKIIKAVLNKDSSAIARYLKRMQIKSDLYARLHKAEVPSKKEPILPETKNRQRLSSPYKLTVFTPAYNRRKTIHRAFESLMAQTCKNFEWLIVDDGSSDNLKELIDEYRKTADFPIRYYYKKNGGKHTAINYSYRLTDSDYYLIVDSDDAVMPDTVKTFLNYWESFTPEQRQRYWCVVGLCKDGDTGEVVGDRFPDGINESENPRALAATVKGEKSSCMRTEVLKQFPFPEPKGTNFITESIVWNKIDKQYRQYYVNDVVRVYYQNEPDSLITSWYKNHIKEGYVSNYYWMKSNLNDGCGSLKSKTVTVLRMAYYGCVCGKGRKEISSDIESCPARAFYNMIFWVSPLIKALRHDKMFKEE